MLFEDGAEGIIYTSFGANMYGLPLESLVLFLEVLNAFYYQTEILINILNIYQYTILQDWWLLVL